MHNSPNLSSIALTAILKQQSQPSRPSTKPTVSDCVGVTRGYPYASHFAARPASSARVYTSTILAVFQRPCAMISCVGAPAAAIRLAMPTRPEWPEKPDPQPGRRGCGARSRARTARRPGPTRPHLCQSIQRGSASRCERPPRSRPEPGPARPPAPVRALDSGRRCRRGVPFTPVPNCALR